MEIYNESEKAIVISQTKDPLLNYLTKRIIILARKHISFGGSVIDLGCGIGRTCTDLANEGYVVTGLDINHKALRIAKKRLKKNINSISYIKDNLTKNPSEKLRRKFEGVICSEVIEHIDPRKCNRLLANINLLLKKKGHLILTTPNDPKQWSILDEYAEHTQRFTIDQMRLKLESHGFRIKEVFTIGFPSTRLLLLFYHYFMKYTCSKHNFNNYGQSFLYLRVYFPIVSFLLYFDSLFDWIKEGTTMIIVSEKKP